MTPFEMVAAVDAEWGIGRAGGLPWHLAGDMAHFVRLTRVTEREGARNAVIMGRKTWDSIPPKFRPLAGRLNVVVSRNLALEVEPGVRVAASLEEALDRAARSGVERIFIIGGASLYRLGLALPGCRRVHLTRVEGHHRCDAFFPELGPDWDRETRSDAIEADENRYHFETWVRTHSSSG